MKQLIMNSSGVMVSRMPRPAVERGAVLVKTTYSFVSVGTEIATLLPVPQEPSTPAQRVQAASSLARRYVGKAVKDPRKAARKLAAILGSRVRRYIPQPPQPDKPVVEIPEIHWRKANARSFEAKGGGLLLTTDDSDFQYQCIGKTFNVPEGYGMVVELGGELKGGALSLGFLAGENGHWIGAQTLPAGRVDERLIFDSGSNSIATIVIANSGVKASVELRLDQLKITLVPPQAGIPHTEMDQQGWGIGYSLAGEIVAIGAGVTDLAVGDMVACCGAGKANHADYVVVKRNMACRIPKGCDPRWASATTIGTIAMQGVRRSEPQLGERVAVLGLGLIGQMTVQMLRAAGCTVLGLDLDEERLQRALSLGMEAGASDTDRYKQLIRDMTGGKGVDRTLITAATKSHAVINLSMEITRAKGTVVIVGDVGLNVERSHFYRKEIDLLMSSSYGPGRYDRAYEEDGVDYPMSYVRWTLNRNMASYMDLIASGRLNIEALVDREAPIDQAPDVYRSLLAEGSARPMGVLFSYPQGAEEAAPEVIVMRGHRKPQRDLINYVLVGAGAFGTSMLVPQMEKRRDRYFLKGVVSRDAIRGGNFVRANSLELLSSDLPSVVARDDVDLAVIATRHDQHAEQVICALQAGKHVFVEKPLALNWEDLDRVAQTYTALQEKPLLMVGFNRRFSPAMQLLKQQLEARHSPLMICYRLNGGYIAPDHWVQNKEGGGRNIGEACHMYDVFRFLTGAPVVSIQAASIDPLNTAYLRNDNFSATLTYADGSVATLIYTAVGPKTGLPKERVEVFCDGQAFVVDDYKALLKAGEATPLWESKDADKGHLEELSRFGDAIAGGNAAPISFDDIVETSAVALQVEDILFAGADNE
ncbi:hypothetical protein BH11PSE11_BH11PSE11_02470 [soil metagenome]